MQQHIKSSPNFFARCRGVSFAEEFASSARCSGESSGLVSMRERVVPSTVVAESGGKVFLVEFAVFHVESTWGSERLEYDLGLAFLGENGGCAGGCFLGE